MSAQEHSDKIDFGFEEIPADQKTARVRQVFDRVADRYDVMNDLMSLGIHRAWKDRFVDMLAPTAGLKLIDMAGGTGDVAFRVADRLTARGARGEITVCDINANMLAVGRDRAIDSGRLDGLRWSCVNAEALPFADRSADAYTVAFGIRNVTERMTALREARRVLRRGGRFLCLEFSTMTNTQMQQLYDRYSFAAIPRMGQMVAGDRDSYQYLVESIRRFPDQGRFAAELEEAGFAQVSVTNLSGGIAAIHSGWVL